MSKYLQLALHPAELKSVAQLVLFRAPTHTPPNALPRQSLVRCYDFLSITSRSFASVIKELHPELKDAVMIFYLVLRALDTVEDDMLIDNAVKVPILRSFDAKLDTRDWTFNGNAPTEKDRIVLVEFDVILSEYHRLRPEYRAIIRDIAGKMGNGMADYIADKAFNDRGIDTIAGYDLYCHYVAGLVGEGLTRMIVCAGFAHESLDADKFRMSESMGLFLQKTNIIRDYHEDLVDGRAFWPREIWGKYTSDFKLFHHDTSPALEFQAVACVSEMVLNALTHVHDCLGYLARIRDPSTFGFCAIPQVMAVATLELVYQNPRVFHQNVKLRKGTTCRLILQSRTLPGVVAVFREYAQRINHKLRAQDPNYLKIGISCARIEKLCELMYPTLPMPAYAPNAVPASGNPDAAAMRDLVSARAQIDREVQETVSREETRMLMAAAAVAAVLASLVAVKVV